MDDTFPHTFSLASDRFTTRPVAVLVLERSASLVDGLWTWRRLLERSLLVLLLLGDSSCRAGESVELLEARRQSPPWATLLQPSMKRASWNRVTVREASWESCS